MKQKGKKQKKNLKPRKSGQSAGWLRFKKKTSLQAIGEADRQKLASTTTGEIFQPVRLHYEISNADEFLASLSKLACIDYDSGQNRWVWLYAEEARSLDFKQKADEQNPVVLGEFLFKGEKEVMLNLRSFERGYQAVEFFDKYMPRAVAKVTRMTMCTKLFSIEEALSIGSLGQYFKQTQTLVRNPEQMTQELIALASESDDPAQRVAALDQYIEKLEHEPIPELEQFPVHYYEEGIGQLKLQLNLSKMVAFQQWQGNTDYTAMDAVRNVVSGQAG